MENKEERFNISVNKEQLFIIIDTLENMARFNTGQVNEIFKDVLWNSDRLTPEDIDDLSKVVKSKIFPDLDQNAYFSIGIREDDKLSVVKQKQYEIYREIRHQLELINPSGNKHSVYDSPTTIESGLPKVRLKKEQ